MPVRQTASESRFRPELRLCGKSAGIVRQEGCVREPSAPYPTRALGCTGPQEAPRARCERRGAADRRQLERMSKLIAGVGAAVSSAQRRPQLHARLRVLELRRGPAQDLHRFLEQSEPALAALDQTGYAEGGAKRPR